MSCDGGVGQARTELVPIRNGSDHHRISCWKVVLGTLGGLWDACMGLSLERGLGRTRNVVVSFQLMGVWELYFWPLLIVLSGFAFGHL